MAQMLFGRFWLQNKDLGPSVGAIDIIFRAGSVPMGSNPPSPLLPVSAKSWPRCCSADFGSRIKISAHPLGRSTSFFEPDLFRWVPGAGGWVRGAPHWKLRGRGGPGGRRGGLKIELRFIPRRFLKGTPVANSYIPYKRPAPIQLIAKQ